MGGGRAWSVRGAERRGREDTHPPDMAPSPTVTVRGTADSGTSPMPRRPPPDGG